MQIMHHYTRVMVESLSLQFVGDWCLGSDKISSMFQIFGVWPMFNLSMVWASVKWLCLSSEIPRREIIYIVRISYDKLKKARKPIGLVTSCGLPCLITVAIIGKNYNKLTWKHRRLPEWISLISLTCLGVLIIWFALQVSWISIGLLRAPNWACLGSGRWFLVVDNLLVSILLLAYSMMVAMVLV